MSVIVKGMEMPEYTTKAEFGIDADGNPLCMVYHEAGTEPDIYDIVPLPERHGRLIDADAYIEMMQKECDESAILDGMILKVCRGGVKAMSTIVEAEGD